MTGAPRAAGGRRAVALLALLAVVLLVLLLLRTDEPVRGEAAAVAPPAAGEAEAVSESAAQPSVFDPRIKAGEPLRLQAAAAEAAPGAALAGSRAVAGRVLRERDGAPLPGTQLKVLADSGLLTTVAADDGSFRLEGLPRRATMLQVELAIGPDTASRQVNLPTTDGDLLDLEILLDTGCTLRGVVRDGSGAPVAGAAIELWPFPVRTVADAQGRFELPDALLPRERLIEVRARAPWHAPGKVDLLVPAARDEALFAEVRLARCGRIEVRPLAPDGTPVLDPQLAIDAEPQDGAHDRGGGAAADPATGVRVIDHLAAGRYVVKAQRGHRDWWAVEAGRAGGFPTLVPDVVVRDGETTRVDVVLRAGATLAGRVLDSEGAPAAGLLLTVELQPAFAEGGTDGGARRFVVPGAFTDAHGRYRIEGLPAGAAEVRVDDPRARLLSARRRYELRGDEVLPGEDHVLGPGLTLRGQVVDADGTPVADAHVTVEGLRRRPNFQSGDTVLTDDEGWFEVGALPPGTLRLTLSHHERGVLRAEADPAAPPARFVLQPEARLHGLVVDAGSGRPVERFGVRLQFEGYDQWVDTADWPGGRFDLRAWFQPSCSVSVAAPGYALATLRDVEPAESAKEPLHFRLEPAP